MIFIPVQHPALLPRHCSPGKQAILEHNLSGQSQFLWRTVIPCGSVCHVYCLRRGGWAWEEWQIGKKNIVLDFFYFFFNITSDYLLRICVLWLITIISLSWEPYPCTQKPSVPGKAHLNTGLGFQHSSLLFLNCCFGFPYLIPVLACYLAFAWWLLEWCWRSAVTAMLCLPSLGLLGLCPAGKGKVLLLPWSPTANGSFSLLE